MIRENQIRSSLPKFRDWLSGRGAQVLEPTNEWELVRFKAGEKTSIVYRNKLGEVNFHGDAQQAWQAFKSGTPWTGAKKGRRKKMTPMIRALRARDGNLCFYCNRPVSDEEESVEHLVSVTHGGPNHISNLFLTHRGCNSKAGHLSAPEKIAVHVRTITASLRQ